MKCLEFYLPSGAAGMAAGMTRQGITKELKKLVGNNLIKNFKGHTEGYRYYVWFEHEYDYTMFFLVWEQHNPWRHPKVIEKDYPEDWGPNPWLQGKEKT